MKTLRQLSSLFLTFSLGSLLSCGGGSSGGGGGGGTPGMTTISGTAVPGAPGAPGTIQIATDLLDVINKFKTNHTCTRTQDYYYVLNANAGGIANTSAFGNSFPMLPATGGWTGNTSNSWGGGWNSNTMHSGGLTLNNSPLMPGQAQGTQIGLAVAKVQPVGTQFATGQELLFIIPTRQTPQSQEISGYTFILSMCNQNAGNLPPSISNVTISGDLRFTMGRIQPLPSSLLVSMWIQIQNFGQNMHPQQIMYTFQGQGLNTNGITLQ